MKLLTYPTPTTIDTFYTDANGALVTPQKLLLASREVENIFENSDFVYLLNQASGDRQILSKALNISPSQQNYITNSNAGEGLIFYGSTIVPFKDDFPKDTQLYRIMTTKPEETVQNKVVGGGIRYTVMIRGKESFLFHEGNKWFVEAKEDNCS